MVSNAISKTNANPLSLFNTASDLRDGLGEMLRGQLWDLDNSGHGAYISPITDLPEPAADGTPNMIAAFLLLWAVHKKTKVGHAVFLMENIERIEAAAGFMVRAQRPTGCIDLLECNIDSPPDTAFSAIPICLGYEQLLEGGFPDELELLRAMLELFLRKAAFGLINGGVHTPNHRWVVTSTLLLLQKLFPDINSRPTADAYLAETFDINEEGFFIERSASVYDAVCDRSLLIIDRCIGLPAARDAALKNLRLNLQMLNEDGTIETGLSHRQDYGKRSIPRTLASCYLRGYALTGDMRFLSAARGIHEAMKGPMVAMRENNVATVWLVYELLLGVPEPDREVTRGGHLLRGTLHLENAGYWRAGCGKYTVASFRGRPHLLSFQAGDAELASLQIAQAYLGHGQFVGDGMIAGADSLQLVYKGKHPERLAPAYRKPLGHEVPVEKWAEMDRGRDITPMPLPGGSLTIKLEENGLAVEFSHNEIPDGVLGQIAFDFPAGGTWECEGGRVQPQPGQVIFLKNGFGRMTFGTDVIEIGPGCYGHGVWNMRDARGPGECVRVLVTFRSPHAHKFFIRRKQ